MNLTKRLLLATVTAPFIFFFVWEALEAGKYVGEKQSEALNLHIQNSSGSQLLFAMIFAGFVVLATIVFFTLKSSPTPNEE